jgi:hypothetical protein
MEIELADKIKISTTGFHICSLSKMLVDHGGDCKETAFYLLMAAEELADACRHAFLKCGYDLSEEGK